MKRLAFAVLFGGLVLSMPSSPVRGASDGSGYEVTDTGWATHHVTVPDSLNCRDGLRIGDFETQTDVKKRWPSGDIEQAIVTYKATSTGNKRVGCGAASGAVFGTPINPANTTVVIRQRANATWMSSQTLIVTNQGSHAGQTTRYYRIGCENGSGRVSFPSQHKSIVSNTTLNGSNFVRVAWSGMPTCSFYRVYRGTSSSNEQQICRTASSPCDDTGQAASGAYPTSTDSDPGTTYTFTLPSHSVGTGYLVNGIGAVGETTIIADTGSGGLLLGDIVTFAGHSQQYRVTAALSQGTFNIYPALTTEVADNAAITVQDWLKGQHVWERRYVTKANNSGPVRDLIEVWWDIRHYSDGTYQVDVAVNNMLDRSDANGLVYDVDIDIGGGPDEYVRDGFVHGFAHRWRGQDDIGTAKFNSGSFDPAIVVHDFEHYQTNKLLPKFHSTIDNDTYPAPTTSEFDIGGYGDQMSYMGEGGLRQEIGYKPAYTAKFLVHKDVTQRARMLANGDISGNWAAHITRSDGGSIVKGSSHNWWFDVACRGIAPNGPAFCTAEQYFHAIKPDVNGNEAWENAHLPSLNVVPYILTGDRWHLDQIRLWGQMSTLIAYPSVTLEDAGQQSNYPAACAGTLLSDQLRGWAWGLRSIWYANAFMPDSDADLPEFADRLDRNMDCLNGITEPNALNVPLQAARTNYAFAKSVSPSHTWGHIIPWTMDYLVNVLEMVDAWDAIRANNWNTVMRDRILTFLVLLLSSESTSGVEWPRPYGRPFLNATGYRVNGSPNTYVYYSSLSQMLGTLGNPTSPSAPSDTGTNLVIHSSNNTWINPDETQTLAPGHVIQITGGGCTAGFYRLVADQGSGYWSVSVSPGATGTRNCRWKNRRNLPPTVVDGSGNRIEQGWDNAPGVSLAEATGYGELALSTTELAKRVGIRGAAAALTYLEDYPSIVNLRNTDDRLIGYAIDYEESNVAATGDRVPAGEQSVTTQRRALAGEQTLATYRLRPGWATFGIALPSGAAYEGLRVGLLATQTDIKTRWPDGSIRFAIVSAGVRASSSFTISAGPPSGAALTPQWPSASVRFTVSGTTYTATLPPFDGSDSWLSGPQVREARVVVSPTAESVHPLLQVVFDVRSYADGAHRVDVTVQNVKDVAAGNNVVYDVAIDVDGTTVYQKNAVTHPYLTRWRKTFPSWTTTDSAAEPDFASFIAAGAIPAFASTVINATPIATGSRYDILTWGDMTAYMPTAGSRPEIGFYPNWTAQYLVHRTQAQRDYMLKHADLSGSWSGHITEPDGQSLVSLDRYPTYWLDHRSVGRPNGPASLAGTTGLIENAHMPSLTYVPYLVTGDRYYLDQTKLWANFAMLSTWPGDSNFPRTGRGVLTQNPIPGIAWGLRALGEAAIATPDDDPDKAYFTSRVQANLEALDAYSREAHALFGPLELVFPGKQGTSTGSLTNGALVQYSPWLNQYVAWALDYLGTMGLKPVAHLRDRIARLGVRLFTSDPDYPRTFGAPYVLLGARVQVIGDRITYVPTTTMRQLFCDSFRCPTPESPAIRFAGQYGPEARAALLLAERLQVPGAAAARSWLEAQPGVMDDVNARSGLALASPTDRGPSSTGRPAPPSNVRIR